MPNYEALIKENLKSGGRYTDNDVLIDVAYAEALLAIRDPDEQRPVSSATVNKYAGRMRREVWKLAIDPIAVSREGKLINGQQRLEALVLTGLPQRFDILWNADPGEFLTADQQRTRTVGQLFNMAGYKNSANHVAAAAGLLWQYDNDRDGMRRWNKNPAAPDQRFTIMETNRGLQDALVVGSALQSAIKLNVTGAAVGYYLCQRAWPQGQGMLDAYVLELKDGERLTKGDPAKALREWSMTASKDNLRKDPGVPSRIFHLYLFIRTWNQRCQEERVGQLGWKDGFTMLLPYKPGGSGRG